MITGCTSGTRLHALVQGRGSPIVMSHALGLDLHMWDHLAGRYSATHEVMRYDHRGHGASHVLRGPYSMNDLVDDAADLIHRWNRGPVIWLGLSMGGMVGMGLAIRYPDLLKALVAANSTAYYPGEARELWRQRIETVETRGLPAIADAVMGRYFHAAFRAERPDVETIARARLLRTDASGYIACCHAVQGVDWRSGLQNIKCPTLVIAGALDRGTPPAMSEAIAQAIPGARLHILEEASHISVLEQPARFHETMNDFLDRLEAASITK